MKITHCPDECVLSGLEPIHFKNRIIVNELAKVVNPEHTNKDIELLTQKNMTLIELGYIFIHDALFG